jgi:hypothetical protein
VSAPSGKEAAGGAAVVRKTISQQLRQEHVLRAIWGVVTGIAPTNPITVSLQPEGSATSILNGIQCETSYTPRVGDVVVAAGVGTDLWIIGAVGDDTGWQSIAGLGYSNGWADLGGGTITPAYRRQANRVWMRGAMTAGTNAATAFTLPVGARPPATAVLNTAGFTSFASPVGALLLIASTGVVTPTYTGSPSGVALDGLTFSTDP